MRFIKGIAISTQFFAISTHPHVFLFDQSDYFRQTSYYLHPRRYVLTNQNMALFQINFLLFPPTMWVFDQSDYSVISIQLFTISTHLY